MSILLFIVILIILILVHELGHFLAAKKSGIRVDEFGIGFPPKLFGKKYGETEYTVNAIPFGGFVRIFGEDPTDEAAHGPDSARSFINQPKYIQAAVMFAGVFFNALFAWLLISLGFMAGFPMPASGAPEGAAFKNAHLTILHVEDGTPASRAGLAAGDEIAALSAGGETLRSPSVTGTQAFIAAHGGDEVRLAYLRGGVDTEVVLIPEEGIIDGAPAIGIAMDMLGIVTLPVHKALYEGGKTTVTLLKEVVVAFGTLIQNAFKGEANIKNLTGPVGIVGIVGDAADFGVVYLLGLTAFISLNLAVINLIPFPALDGGRLLFLLIEVIKGSPIKPRVVRWSHAVGFALLILLMLAVTYNDLVRIFS